MSDKVSDAAWENIDFSKTDYEPKVEKNNKEKESNFIKDDFSALKLYEFDYEELPKLIDPIFPKVGLVSLVGSSDTGKSTFLRQLGISIALGLDNFVGYSINSTTRNVIFISTEDDPASTSVSIKKPIGKLIGNIDKSVLHHLKFIFDIDVTGDSDRNLFKLLERDLSRIGADLIVVDAFTDVFNGDINSSTKVREFLNQFSKLAKKHNCLVLFLHHTGKRTDKFSANKDNVLGSQAFEAKMRVLLELKHYPNDDSKRTLTITKGNYISSKIKKYSKVLTFNEEELLFYDTGEMVASDAILNLTKFNPKKQEIKPLIEEMNKKKYSLRKMEAELKDQGYSIGKSSISNYIKEMKAGKIGSAEVSFDELFEGSLDENAEPEETL